jgi:hypothetical protein
MKYITFESFVNENKKLDFHPVNNSLLYISDKMRAHMIYDCLMGEDMGEYKEVGNVFLYKQDDLTYTQKVGDMIIQSEMWAQSCWEGLYSKPEYQGLSHKEAIEKFMKERIPKIAELLNLEFIRYEFKNNVSRIFLKIK